MKPVSKLFQPFNSAKLAILLCSSLLVSCGGGTQIAGVGGTGISYGAVTDFGSIILNGSEIDDDTAIVTLDDNPGSGLHGGLKQGMVVKVSGDFNGNTGTASTIEYRDNLEGPVCALAAPITSPIVGIKTLRALGQTVILDATTIVDNNEPINFGDNLEVSGLPDKDGQIHASFIENKTAAGTSTVIEVKGRISALTATTFTINNLLVNYVPQDIDNSIPSGLLVNGLFVEVKGTVFTCGTPDTLTATKIELEPEGAGAIPDGVNAEVEGLVTNIDLMPDSFMIGNRLIDITSSPRYLPQDFGVGDIALGTKVEAEGTSANGVLTATKISFRENVKLESDVDIATISGSSPTFSFELVGLPGIIITTNLETTGVAPAGHIRVRGIEGPDDTVLATRIDDRSGQTDAFLQGPVDAISVANVTILGIPVDTNSIPDPNFKDAGEFGITRATFLSLVEPGTLVKFKGVLAAPDIIWDEAELEDD